MNKIKLTKNTYTKGEVKELILQALELAAENARVSVKPVNLYDNSYFVNKKSIIDTINQVI